MPFLKYLFWPNPGFADYSSASMRWLLGLSVALIILSVLIRVWRSKQKNPVAKKLTKSWAAASLWFGISGAMLVVARVEQIQFLAMRFLWVLWGVALVTFSVFQIRKYVSRHYEVLPREEILDPRDKYLPGKRRR